MDRLNQVRFLGGILRPLPAVPPGDETLFAMALELASGFEPLSAGEIEAVKAKGLAGPLFRYPSKEA